MSKKKLLYILYIVDVIYIIISARFPSFWFLILPLCQNIYSEVCRKAWISEEPKLWKNLSTLSYTVLLASTTRVGLDYRISFVLLIIVGIYWAAVSIKRAEKAGL